MGARSYLELEALRAQVGVLEDLVTSLEPQDWERPSRCPEFSVRELVAHVGGSLGRYGELAQGSADKTTHDRVSWWQYDPAERGPEIAQRTKEGASGKTDEELTQFCLSSCRGLVEKLEGDPDRIVGVDGIGLAAKELAAVGVVEGGIHTMDIGHATLRGEPLHPEAAGVIAGVLDALLGNPLPRAIGWERRTYILTATGRRALEENERFVLRDLADRFPLLG